MPRNLFVLFFGKIIACARLGGINLPTCPLCQTESDELRKEWNYHVYHVKSFNCEKCKKPFQAYYRQDKLSHIISSFTPKKPPHPRVSSVRKRIIRYLRSHDSVGEKEIAGALGLKEAEVLNVLGKLEKKGVVTSFLASEAQE
jgi:DNA replication protein DnaC